MSEPITLKSLLLEFERRAIIGALAATQGNQRQAAAALGLLPSTLHEKMKRLGLKRGPGSGAEFG
jgi:DNA-binding NtrC family response regulator